MDTTAKIEHLTIPNKEFAILLYSILQSGHSMRFQASGSSMHPFTRDGDILTIAPIHSHVTIGDVVCCSTDNVSLIVHRIVKIDKELIYIRGDNLDSEDGVFILNNIHGKVVNIERNGKQSNYSIGFLRYIIAYLSRKNLLHPLNQIIRPIYRVFFKPGDHEHR